MVLSVLSISAMLVSAQETDPVTGVTYEDAGGVACEGAPTPRLFVNGTAGVAELYSTLRTGIHSNNFVKIMLSSADDTARVLAGPFCVTSMYSPYNWYQLEYETSTGQMLTGWATEGTSSWYWLEPVRPGTGTGTGSGEGEGDTAMACYEASTDTWGDLSFDGNTNVVDNAMQHSSLDGTCTGDNFSVTVVFAVSEADAGQACAGLGATSPVNNLQDFYGYGVAGSNLWRCTNS